MFIQVNETMKLNVQLVKLAFWAPKEEGNHPYQGEVTTHKEGLRSLQKRGPMLRVVYYQVDEEVLILDTEEDRFDLRGCYAHKAWELLG